MTKSRYTSRVLMEHLGGVRLQTIYKAIADGLIPAPEISQPMRIWSEEQFRSILDRINTIAINESRYRHSHKPLYAEKAAAALGIAETLFRRSAPTMPDGGWVPSRDFTEGFFDTLVERGALRALPDDPDTGEKRYGPIRIIYQMSQVQD